MCQTTQLKDDILIKVLDPETTTADLVEAMGRIHDAAYDEGYQNGAQDIWNELNPDRAQEAE